MCPAKRLSESERRKEIMDSASKIIIEKGLERGTNENNNILIRRWFPKGSDFDEQITHRKVKSLEHWINTYPRRKLNGFCSKYLFDIEVKKLLC